MTWSKRLDYLWLKRQAQFWLVLGRTEAACATFSRMLQRWPDDRYALASRLHLHAQSKRFDEALADSDALLAANAAGGGDWFNHGYLLESLERWEEALAAFGRATEIDPKLDRAWYGKGLVLVRLQRTEEAVAALKRNTELQPMSAYGWYQLARVHIDRDEPEKARKIIRHLQGFEPQVARQLTRETGLAP
jgi:tetratricopeptide (TPR) repeat protein